MRYYTGLQAQSPRPAGREAAGIRRTAHMIGNAHIDPVWTWQWSEGRAEVRATFASALDRLEEYPEFVFTQNQVVFLDWVAETDPELFERIRAHVTTGRWQLAGGWWVEPDTNLPLGESLVRQALHGQRFLVRHFGVRTDVVLCEDSFGHPASLPQLLVGAGLEHYVFLRPGPHELPLPAGAFTWTGPDGSAVVGYRIPNEYGTSRWDIANHLDKAMAQLPPEGDVAIFYGVGNHGGGPTRANLDTLRRLDGCSDMPRLRPSTLGDYFATLDRAVLPQVTGDLHRHAVGCYSAHGAMKRWMRRAERGLVTAERWASAACRVTGLGYPSAELAAGWEATLFNQFHDILAGTAVPEAYVDARDQLGYAAAVADRVRDRSLQAIASRVALEHVEDTVCHLVFNPHTARATSTVAILHAHGEPGPMRVEDAATGETLPAQTAPASATMNGGARRFLVNLDVRGLGYRALRLVPDPLGVGLPQPPRRLRPDEPALLDNGLVRLRLDPATGRPAELAVPGGPNLLAPGRHAVSREDASDTWGHRVRGFDGTPTDFGLQRILLLEDGPVRRVLRVESRLGASRIVEDYRLAAGSPYVEVAVALTWTATHAVMKLRYPTALADAEARWECAYGSVSRPTDGAEQPLHGYVLVTGQVGGAPAGLAVAVDGPTAGDVAGGDIGLTLARSPLYAWHDPAPAAAAAKPRYLDLGEHAFTLRLVPFTPVRDQPVPPSVTAAAATLVAPLTVLREGAHPGPLPPRGSFAAVTAGTAALTVLKQPEDGPCEDCVIRVFETSGAPTQARVRVGARVLSLDLGPHQLRTLRLPRDRAEAPVELDLCEWTAGARPPVQPLPVLPARWRDDR